MKALASALFIVGLLAGCSKKSAPDPQGWFIESYDNGVITIQHGGYTYKATCRPADPNWNRNVIMQQEGACDWIVELVGHVIRGLDKDDHSVSAVQETAFQQGSTLFLRKPWPYHEKLSPI